MKRLAGVTQELRRLAEAGLETAPITRGVCSCSWPMTPGSIRSGAKATWMFSPATRPRSASGSTSISRVLPT